MSDYLGPEDFADLWEYELYLMSVGINALNPDIDPALAYDSLIGFVMFHGGTDEPIRAEHVLQLIDDLKAGPVSPEGLH